MTEFTGRVVSKDVVVVVIDGKFAADVRCLMCEPLKLFSMYGTKYTADASNFKKHFSRCHLLKGEVLVEGAKGKLKADQQQRSVADYCTKERKEPQEDAEVVAPIDTPATSAAPESK